jgi:hypothetical protein
VGSRPGRGALTMTNSERGTIVDLRRHANQQRGKEHVYKVGDKVMLLTLHKEERGKTRS